MDRKKVLYIALMIVRNHNKRRYQAKRRRPPQQKFTNFEEYMTAHGGATAPIEDHSEEV